MDAKCEAGDLPVKEADSDFKSECMETMRKVPGLGILLALISGICFATAGFTVELMEGVGDDGGWGVDACVIVVIRGLVQLAFYLPASLCFGDPLTGVTGERWYLFHRALWGFVCFAASYYALSYASLSDVSAIAFSAPVFVSVFACVLLKEPCGTFQISTIICTLVGVFLIARPSFIFGRHGEDRDFTATERLIGTGLSFFTALTMAYTFVVMRRLQKTPTSTVITFFSLFSIVVGTVVALVLKYTTSFPVRLPAKQDIIYLFINGMCGVVGQLFLTISLKIEEAGLVSLTRTFDIVMAFIYQVTCLHQDAPLLSIIGAVIVSGGCVVCGLKKFIEAKPDALKAVSFGGSKKSYTVNATVIPYDNVDKH